MAGALASKTAVPRRFATAASGSTKILLRSQQLLSGGHLQKSLRTLFTIRFLLRHRAIAARAIISCLKPPNPNCQGTEHFPNYGGPGFPDFHSQSVGCLNHVYYNTTCPCFRPCPRFIRAVCSCRFASESNCPSRRCHSVTALLILAVEAKPFTIVKWLLNCL